MVKLGFRFEKLRTGLRMWSFDLGISVELTDIAANFWRIVHSNPNQ